MSKIEPNLSTFTRQEKLGGDLYANLIQHQQTVECTDCTALALHYLQCM